MLELEKEKLEQNNRMELLMTALMRQVRGAPLSNQAVEEEMTPMHVRGGRPGAVIDQAAAFRRVVEGNTPSTQQKYNRSRPGQGWWLSRLLLPVGQRGSSGTQGSRWLGQTLLSWRGETR